MTTATNADPRTLQLDDAVIAYDVWHAAADSDHALLLMIGQPMTALGFHALAGAMPERRVITYDPRGLGRSTRSDGSKVNDPQLQAADLHALIAEIGGGAPVDMFASSGGAITALALVAEHPPDLRVLVAHEPPLFTVLPDAAQVAAASARVEDAYHRHGFGTGMATFIELVSQQGPLTDEYLERPLPDPAQFGLPATDDGSRDDPLMSAASASVTAYALDLPALRAAPTRIVLGIGEQSGELVTARASRVIAEQLGSEPVMFRGGHGGFSADEWGTPGDPARFAQQLRDVLDA
jgi:pimeloyl-ACP methyl ester carboxylesterase